MFYECYFNYRKVDDLGKKIVDRMASYGLHVEFPSDYEHLSLTDKKHRQIQVRIYSDSQLFTEYMGGEKNTLLPFDVLLTHSLKFGKNDGKVGTRTIPIIEKNNNVRFSFFEDTAETISDPHGKIDEYPHRLEMSQQFTNNLGSIFPVLYMAAVAEIFDGIFITGDEFEPYYRTMRQNEIKKYASITIELIDEQSISMELKGEDPRYFFVEFKGWNKTDAPEEVSNSSNSREKCNCLNWLKKLFK